ncbi:MAG: hypothetical protein MZV70_31715 [Desulfobacterales bacterium]|nr:hypothetical protein [Desulfobacterales bacterium]
MEKQTVVGGTLNVGFAAHRRDAAAGDAHVTQKQLNNAHRTDILDTDRMLRPAHRVEFNAGLVGFAC